ncbi:hypothetical protein BDV29DRAFT_173366 [Aspergillus leporis]|uniref:Uncharacterized protein n=1 Tax=Aspergillus leporis TaxID=41062 RepID=A0A5N5X1M3_9EURO|nr:hypothetical protein BDV29DRAFT_173366 [Aspergillus leporis]
MTIGKLCLFFLSLFSPFISSHSVQVLNRSTVTVDVARWTGKLNPSATFHPDNGGGLGGINIYQTDDQQQQQQQHQHHADICTRSITNRLGLYVQQAVSYTSWSDSSLPSVTYTAYVTDVWIWGCRTYMTVYPSALIPPPF